MANQITHIVLAQKLPELTKFSAQDFYIGTVLPDVRYLKVIERDKTHFKNLSLEKVLEEKNDFVAGMKYHSLVDEVREAFIVSRDLYSKIPQSRYITQVLKCLEDELYYTKVVNWNVVCDFFEHIPKEETDLISKEAAQKWHALLVEYFKQNPSDFSREAFIQGLGFPLDVCNEINTLVAELRVNDAVLETISHMYINWDRLMKEYGKN